MTAAQEPTPDVDATTFSIAIAGGNHSVVFASLARKLERQRDEDAERLDYLEREMELEDNERANYGHVKRMSLFRMNIPITRQSIDAARKEKT